MYIWHPIKVSGVQRSKIIWSIIEEKSINKYLLTIEKMLELANKNIKRVIISYEYIFKHLGMKSTMSEKKNKLGLPQWSSG